MEVTADPNQCPKGKQCPEGFTSKLWCDVCNAEPERLPLMPQPVEVQPDPIIVGDLHPPISNATIQKDGTVTVNVGGKLHGIPKKINTVKGAPPAAKNTTGHMVSHVMPARFDSECKCCSAPIAENDPLSGVRPSFYEMAPLRWVCQNCGNLYEHAYTMLAKSPGNTEGQIETVQHPNFVNTINTGVPLMILTYEWDDLDQKWREVRATHVSAHRVRPDHIILHHTAAP